MEIHIVIRSNSESTSVIGAFKTYKDAKIAQTEAEVEEDSSMPSEYEINTTILR